MKDELVCSLDIGTRSIIGLVGRYIDDEKFQVVAYAIKEHKKRNMYDGQIHDIEGVAVTVKEIINELEEKINEKLKVVSIAAAGRALKTERVIVDKEIDGTIEISKRLVESLELEAVQKAQEKVNQDQNINLKYYNIGYTVVNYFLEDNKMEELSGHRGDKIGVELLATFLPQVVIESLYSVMSKVGLEVGSITLEPIAAINVAIKKELRLLNLALVDIGAGTSDIAITKSGEISFYGMTQLAGDEITERLATKFLLDFNSSEKLKVELSKKDEHEFTDVVGITYKLSTREIVDKVMDVIEEIAGEIADKIIEFNEKAPDAVFLIGGSSQMPFLKEKIAEKLGLPKERVSIRDTSFIEDVEGLGQLTGPDMITPIGIAVEGLSNKYKNFLKVTFNKEEVRIFNTDNIKVSDVLILTNYNPKDLMPKASDRFVYYINGKKRTILGEIGKAPEILVNGEKANLKTKLNDEDTIEITENKIIPIEAPKLYDVIDLTQNVEVNGKKISLIKEIRINGEITKENIKLKSEDDIWIKELNTIEELFNHNNIEINNADFYINQVNAKLNNIIKNADKISVKYNAENSKTKKIDVKESKKNSIKLIINDQEKELFYKKDRFVFVDIFDHIDFNLTKPQGKLCLKVNGRDADYLEELNQGDKLTVLWEKE